MLLIVIFLILHFDENMGGYCFKGREFGMWKSMQLLNDYIEHITPYTVWQLWEILVYYCVSFLQGLLEGVSLSFTKNFHFIDSVKAYLSYALLRASVSTSPTIFQVWAKAFCFSVAFNLTRQNILKVSFQFFTSMQQGFLQYSCCGSGKVLKYVCHSSHIPDI